MRGPPPAFAQPPHFVFGNDEYRVWFCTSSTGGPPGFLTQMGRIDQVREEHAVWIVDKVYPAFTERHPRGPYVFAHDWSLGLGYETGARTRLVQWGMQVRAEVDSISLVVSEDAHPLVRMAVSVGTSSLAVVGMDIRVGYSLPNVIEQHGWTPERLD